MRSVLCFSSLALACVTLCLNRCTSTWSCLTLAGVDLDPCTTPHSPQSTQPNSPPEQPTEQPIAHTPTAHRIAHSVQSRPVIKEKQEAHIAVSARKRRREQKSIPREGGHLNSNEQTEVNRGHSRYTPGVYTSTSMWMWMDNEWGVTERIPPLMYVDDRAQRFTTMLGTKKSRYVISAKRAACNPTNVTARNGQRARVSPYITQPACLPRGHIIVPSPPDSPTQNRTPNT